MEIQFKKMNFKKFLFFMFFISISVNASDLEFNEKGLVCFAENNIYNSIGFWFGNGIVEEYRFDPTFGGDKNKILNMTELCINNNQENCSVPYSVKKNNIVFYQQSVGLDVLVNIKTLKLKWPSLENYYVLACKKIHDKNDINKKLLELID